MQKQISKQGLAIVALSLLLAVCMALTATFAVFKTSETVNGSITFSGNSVLSISGFGEATNQTYTYSKTSKIAGITDGASYYSTGSIGLTSSSAASYLKVTFTLTADKGVDITLTAPEGWYRVSATNVFIYKGVSGTDGTPAKAAPNYSIEVSNFINSISVDRMDLNGNGSATISDLICFHVDSDAMSSSFATGA